jgi:glycosyltransferase involved in cell wall biosynthesis
MNDNRTTNPGYSIVIPVYNSEKTLPDTLRSVFGLEHTAFETIVVDDGSTDGSADLARSMGAKVVALSVNQGPANARNQGAQHASYDALLFTDSDVLLPKRLLLALDERFRESGADAIQGTFSEVCPFANYFSQYKNLYNRFVLNRLPDWIDTTFTSITAVKRSSFLDCGGFDANIRGASVEDRTLGRNLIQNGFRIRFDRSLEVIHNKKLTWRSFLRNQFRRSRDLAKLLLRNREEKPTQPTQTAASFNENGRFGTNAPSTMIRIPIAFVALLLGVLSSIDLVFVWFSLLFLLVFMGLIGSFEKKLMIKRGFQFALLGVPVNLIDAIASGMGVSWGVFEYFLLKKKY